MLRFKKILTLTLMACLSLWAFSASADEDVYQHQETKDLVNLVQQAADLINTKGEAAFNELDQKGSKWFDGEKYIFVDTTDGVEVVNPAFPDVVGKNLIDIKDPWGKPIVRFYIEEVTIRDEGKTEGWTHYQWPKPGTKKPVWKTAYIALATAPNGKKYVVGSGLYDMKPEKAFVEDEVEDAVALIEKQGKKAFDTLRDKSSEFVFRNTYVFVDTSDGVEVVNPAFPEIEGKDLLDLKDSNGKYMVRDYIELAKTKGEGWIDYMWPKPGQKEPSRKHSFVKAVKIDGELYVVGCGVYLD